VRPDNLDRRHRKLLGVIAGLSADKLDETVPGKTCPVTGMLHSTTRHYASNAGRRGLPSRASDSRRRDEPDGRFGVRQPFRFVFRYREQM